MEHDSGTVFYALDWHLSGERKKEYQTKSVTVRLMSFKNGCKAEEVIELEYFRPSPSLYRG